MSEVAANRYIDLMDAKEWDHWVIGSFDPSFKWKPQFFKDWNDNGNCVIEPMWYPHDGYDLAKRFSRQEAEAEMLLLQACVGPEIHLYLLPIL